MGIGIRMRATGRVARITLSEEHIPVSGRTAVSLEAPDGLRQTILALPEAEVTHALGQALDIAGPTHPVGPTGGGQSGQDGVPAGHAVGVVADGGPAALEHDGLILHAQEGGVVVLDVAALQLHGATAGLRADGTDLADGPGDAGGAVGHGEVAAALVEAVDGVLGAGAEDGEVVVGGVGGRVHQGGDERVEVGLVCRVGHVLLLRAPLEHERVYAPRGTRH